MNLSAEDPRRSPRSKIFTVATLERAGEPMPVVLRDLSEHGALIEIQAALEIETEILFRHNELRVRAFVAWVQDGLAGICFDRPLRSEAVARHINRCGGAAENTGRTAARLFAGRPRKA